MAVDKQKRPDSSVSGDDDDSEAFPTSDDHPIASYSASASDQGPDVIERSNRFRSFHVDDENEKIPSGTTLSFQTRQHQHQQPQSNSNKTLDADNHNNDDEQKNSN